EELDAAQRDKNLRAAALALEEMLQADPDNAELRKQFEGIRDDLNRYDENRKKGLDLRRDPAQLEDAHAALQEAQKVWDTPQVQQDLSVCTLARQKRRDRLSVAEFEVRGEVGIPEAGRTVAEELLPAFKNRFDLVERQQLGKIIDELKIQPSG